MARTETFSGYIDFDMMDRNGEFIEFEPEVNVAIYPGSPGSYWEPADPGDYELQEVSIDGVKLNLSKELVDLLTEQAGDALGNGDIGQADEIAPWDE